MQLPLAFSDPSTDLNFFSLARPEGFIPNSVTSLPDIGKIDPGMQIPGIPQLKTGGGGLFGGMTGLEKANLGLTGLSTLGGLFLGLKQLGLANKQFNLQRSVANANLANQISAYNTTLADRSRSRAAVEGQTPDQAKAYVDQNKLAARPL